MKLKSINQLIIFFNKLLALNYEINICIKAKENYKNLLEQIFTSVKLV